jgi:hypothetical protein
MRRMRWSGSIARRQLAYLALFVRKLFPESTNSLDPPDGLGEFSSGRGVVGPPQRPRDDRCVPGFESGRPVIRPIVHVRPVFAIDLTSA